MVDNWHEVDVVTTIVKNLMEELETAKSASSKSNINENCGEVRCINSAINKLTKN